MPNKKKILIIEDEEMIGSMYKTKLEADGFEVVNASTGMDGLEKAKQQKFDLIMLDVILPQLDGFSVLKELKNSKETKDFPVILLTNLGTDEDKDKGKKLGAVDYLVKASSTPTEISKRVKDFFKK